MKIYTCYTDSHKILLDKFFIPSVKEAPIDIIIKKFPQECPSAEYMQEGWIKTMIRKVEYHIKSCEENLNEAFLYADCDVQFFGDISPVAQEELSGCDIACQDDVHPYIGRNTYCAGVFLCVGNNRTIKFWNDILNRLIALKPNEKYHDQDGLNQYINQLNHRFLSHKFYTVAQTTKKLWNNDSFDFAIPKNILVHHANWTHGVENKIKLLELVRNKYYENTNNGS